MNLVTCRGMQMLYDCAIHTHENWELILQCVGNAHAYVGDKTFEMSPGDLLLIPPYTPHNCSHEQQFGDMFIGFSRCEFRAEPLLTHDVDGNIAHLMQMILKLHTEREVYHEEIADAMLDVILSYLKKNLQRRIKYPFAADFKDVLYENLSVSDFDLGGAIASSGYHPDYFRRCFKAEFGSSPLEYLIKLRMTRAQELLAQDSFLGVEGVATRCGFADSFYFSTCFKKHTGLSPMVYRKQKKMQKGPSTEVPEP